MPLRVVTVKSGATCPTCQPVLTVESGTVVGVDAGLPVPKPGDEEPDVAVGAGVAVLALDAQPATSVSRPTNSPKARAVGRPH